MIEARVTPTDVARWLFWVPLRDALDPRHPGRVRALHAGWRVRYLAAGRGRRLMADELCRSFPRIDIQRTVRDAYRSAWRVHLEELLLGKLTADTVESFIRFEGREHIDAALGRGKGIIWLYPHAGPVMQMLAWLALKGYRYTQYASRGLPPDEFARQNPELLGRNRLRERVREVREDNEDRLPARFIDGNTPVRELYRRLARNELVGIAYDGRIGMRWWPVTYLGRTALLSPGPYRLATSTGATVVPAYCRALTPGPAVCVVGEPIEPGRDWEALARKVLDVEQDFIRRWPAEYGTWLLHCRLRNGIDDHPLFIDHAEGDRWRRWVK